MHLTVLTTQLDHLASLAKWLSVRLRTEWLWVRVPLQKVIDLFNNYAKIRSEAMSKTKQGTGLKKILTPK